MPQRATCTCKHGDSTISDPRKQPTQGTAHFDGGWLQRAAGLRFRCGSKFVFTAGRQRTELCTLGNECSCDIHGLLATHAESRRLRQQTSCRVSLVRRITAGTKDGVYCTYGTSVLSQGHRTNQRLYMDSLVQNLKLAPQNRTTGDHFEAGSLSACCPLSFLRLAACQKDQARVPIYLPGYAAGTWADECPRRYPVTVHPLPACGGQVTSK